MAITPFDILSTPDLWKNVDINLTNAPLTPPYTQDKFLSNTSSLGPISSDQTTLTRNLVSSGCGYFEFTVDFFLTSISSPQEYVYGVYLLYKSIPPWVFAYCKFDSPFVLNDRLDKLTLPVSILVVVPK